MHWIGGWVSHSDGLDVVSLRKIPCLCQQPHPGRPAHSLY